MILGSLINGVSEERLHASDRGLHYGDGLFETMSVRNRRARYFDRHMSRLEQGCLRLGLPAPAPGLVADEIEQVCRDADSCVVKLILTRGQGGRGYAPPAEPRVTRVVLSYPWPAGLSSRRERGVRVRLCRTRLAINPALAGIKHLNRLEQVLAWAEKGAEDAAEGLMFDTEGCLVEAIAGNVFLVRDGRLSTPALDRCGVAGVMRERVIELARSLAIDCEVVRIGREKLRRAEEIFLTNVVGGIVPVRRLENRPLAARGVTGRLLGALREDRE